MNWSSYQVRLPLSLAAVVAITATVLSLAIAYQTTVNIGVEQQRTAQRLAHAMQPVLARALKHDDIWLAFSLLRGPERPSGDGLDRGSPALLVVDESGAIFAAAQPRRFPTGMPLADVDRDLARRLESPGTQRGGPPEPRTNLFAIPIHSGDEVTGTLVVRFAEEALWLRFGEIALGGAWAVLLTLALVIPIGWIWGRRMVAPLATLTACMARIGETDLSELRCPPLESGDNEIGQLGRQFQALLDDLEGKRALEEQVVLQERLAAIGRVAAGVAHEINNPLGGLLAAIDTYRRKPTAQRDVDRTLDLVERGLNQIHETVSAMLVESRLETRALTRQDIDDVETLVRADSNAGDKTIHWASSIAQDLPLPATSVRQVLLNLALNAVQSTPSHGRVEVAVAVADGFLQIEVRNQGPPIPPERLPHLFEPFYSDRSGGTGLGLWTTYQSVTQLDGRISVDSRGQGTLFRVVLPLAHGVGGATS